MPAHLGVGGLYELILSLRDGQENQELVLTRSLFDNEMSLGQPGQDSETRVLLSDVKAVDFAYYGPKEKEDPAWHDNWAGEAIAPSLIRVSLAREDGELWPPITVRVLINGIQHQRGSGGADREPELEDDEEDELDIRGPRTQS